MTVPCADRHHATMFARNCALSASPIARFENALATPISTTWPLPCLLSQTALSPAGSIPAIPNTTAASVGVAVHRSAGNSENAAIEPTPFISGCLPVGESFIAVLADTPVTRRRRRSRSVGERAASPGATPGVDGDCAGDVVLGGALGAAPRSGSEV